MICIQYYITIRLSKNNMKKVLEVTHRSRNWKNWSNVKTVVLYAIITHPQLLIVLQGSLRFSRFKRLRICDGCPRQSLITLNLIAINTFQGLIIHQKIAKWGFPSKHKVFCDRIVLNPSDTIVT